MTFRSPFKDIEEALGPKQQPVDDVEGLRVDLRRPDRCGLAEVVYCSGKTEVQITSGLAQLASEHGHALGSRVEPAMADAIVDALTSQGFEANHRQDARMLVVGGQHRPRSTGGRVGILTAGTSDWPVAAEATIVAEASGCSVEVFRDVGVAGLHRLVQPLLRLMEFDCDVLIVVAGMDGVLPTVVAGLVEIPVIALPTSTGYGHGGSGEGAMTTMLQSCATGVAVVNIDNGIGAASMAALIANRAARARNP